ncbi:dihydroxyacetone kinase subunit DhaK, partial [Anaerostipes caccae]
YIVYDRVEEVLAEKGISVHKAYVGNYFTSLEMMGVTLTVMKLDDELKECIDMPCDSVGLKQLQGTDMRIQNELYSYSCWRG